jgi:transcriptional regulator with XRE-family HTH domain
MLSKKAPCEVSAETPCRLRTRRSLTQERLGEFTAMHRTEISLLERAGRERPLADAAQALDLRWKHGCESFRGDRMISILSLAASSGRPTRHLSGTRLLPTDTPKRQWITPGALLRLAALVSFREWPQARRKQTLEMRRHWQDLSIVVRSLVFTGFALGVMPLGCGCDGSDSTQSDIDFTGNSLAKCLKDNGATFKNPDCVFSICFTNDCRVRTSWRLVRRRAGTWRVAPLRVGIRGVFLGKRSWMA